MHQQPTLLTPDQVSSILGVKKHTLAVWRSSGRYKLPFIKAGRLVRYRLSDVEAFLQEQSRTSTGLMEASA